MQLYSPIPTHVLTPFPGASDSKASSCNAGDPGSTPGSLPGKFHGMRSLVAPWGSTIHGVRESDTTEQLHFHFSPVTVSSNILNRITSAVDLTHGILSTAF